MISYGRSSSFRGVPSSSACIACWITTSSSNGQVGWVAIFHLHSPSSELFIEVLVIMGYLIRFRESPTSSLSIRIMFPSNSTDPLPAALLNIHLWLSRSAQSSPHPLVGP